MTSENKPSHHHTHPKHGRSHHSPLKATTHSTPAEAGVLAIRKLGSAGAESAGRLESAGAEAAGIAAKIRRTGPKP
jgi:hypothetical protein